MSIPQQPNDPDHKTPSTSTPDFWESATPHTSANSLPPVEAPTPEHHNSGGRGYGITALIVAVCSLVLGIVTPHFAAILVAGGGVVAAIGMKKSTGGARKLAVAGLVASVIVFVLCVIYTIVTYVIWGPSIYEQL